MTQVATTAGGRYCRALDAGPWQGVPGTITVAYKRVDVADTLARVGGMLAALNLGLSLWWNRFRVPRTPRSAVR